MQVAVFADGSHKHRTRIGGYAAARDHWLEPNLTIPVGQAVAVSGEGLNNNICELLAIILALHLLKSDFETMMAARKPKDGELVEAKGIIFSDSRQNIELLQTGICSDPLQRKLAVECVAEAHKLLSVPGLKLSLELRWVPSHNDAHLRVERHEWVDRLSKHARNTQVSGTYFRSAANRKEGELLLRSTLPSFWEQFLERQGSPPPDEGSQLSGDGSPSPVEESESPHPVEGLVPPVAAAVPKVGMTEPPVVVAEEEGWEVVGPRKRGRRSAS